MVNVLTVPRPGGLWSVKPVLSNEAIPGAERLTAIEKRYSTSATVAGINGDLFGVGGAPSGILMRNGALDQPPLPGRSSIGLDANGALNVARVTMLSTWQGTGPRRALNDVNGPLTPNGVSLFTPAYGASTPSSPGSVELTLASFPPARPNTEISGTVTAASTNGGTPIPPTGAVLVARGTAATFMQRRRRGPDRPDPPDPQAGVGDDGRRARRRPRDRPTASRSSARTRTSLPISCCLAPRAPPSVSSPTGAFSLSPSTARGPATASGRRTSSSRWRWSGSARSPPRRSTAGLLDDGLRRQAAQPALRRRAADRRRVARLLLRRLRSAALEPVLSPNGDGVYDRQRLSYKVVRPSTVTANLIGPDGVAADTFTGPVAPGTYPLDWTGTKPDGTPELEGAGAGS